MEPTQASSSEAPIPGSSPLHPPLNGPELSQRTTPLSSILGSSATDQEPPIFSPIPTRPRPSQLAEAGPSTASMEMEADTTPRDVHTEIDRRLSTPINTTERLRRLSRLRQRQRRRGHLAEEEPRGAEKDSDQQGRELMARRARRHGAFSTDGLADDLSTLSTDEPERNPVEEDMELKKHQSRKLRTRKLVIARDQLHAERARQMRDVEQRIQGGVGGMDVVEEGEGLASGAVATDVRRADIRSIFGGPTEDSDVWMFGPRVPNHPQSEEKPQSGVSSETLSRDDREGCLDPRLFQD